MKISRYIYVPFIFGASYALINYFIAGHSLNWLIWDFIWFALFGFGILIYSDYRVRKFTSTDNEEAFNVRQKRSVALFTNYAKAFDLCLESISVLKNAKIKHEDKLQGIIKVKTGLNWHTFGNKITYKLTELSETATEIEIFVEPIPKTTLIDYGEGFKIIEDINNFLDKENEAINKKYIQSKIPVPTEFASKNNKLTTN